MELTVSQLIKELEKVPNQNLKVVLLTDLYKGVSLRSEDIGIHTIENYDEKEDNYSEEMVLAIGKFSEN